jgi:predicted phosphodiesterase
MKLMIAGDTHGNFLHLLDLIVCAQQNDIDYILQLGDFGYWEHTENGKVFLDELSTALVKANVYLDFIDGNHENLPMLWETYGNKFTQVRPNLHYRPRGGTWYIDGLPVMGLGGAFSIDARWRREVMAKGKEECWWPEEELTDFEVKAATVAGGVASPVILFTHDAPDGAPISQLSSVNISNTLQARSQDNRIRVRKVMDSIKPDVLFHGHFHTRIDYELGPVLCHGLGCDTDGMAMRGERVRSLSEDRKLINRGLDLFEESYVIIETQDYMR